MTLKSCFYPLIGDKIFGWPGDLIDTLSGNFKKRTPAIKKDNFYKFFLWDRDDIYSSCYSFLQIATLFSKKNAVSTSEQF